MSPEDQELVREQVGRILSSVLFRNSKRFPAFLRFTVEHVLTSGDPLKERTIGHEVFGRDPDYDTAQDPVVRMTAAEVRKRLSQYYQSREHAGELVINYQPGTYLPEFDWPTPQPAAAPAVPPSSPDEPVPDPPRQARSSRASALWLGAALIATALVLGVALTRKSPPPSDAVAHFWAPLISSAEPVLLCIGDMFSPGQVQDPNAAASVRRDDLTIEEFLQTNSVRFTDSVTMSLLAGELRARAKPFRIRRPASTEFKDLRDGPVVLIGGFNNPWTLRLSHGLRFTLASDPNGAYISDASRPDFLEWRTPIRTTRLKDLSRTFGLITRIKDPATGQIVMIVSGLVLGTRAAAECLIDAPCLESAEPTIGADWDQKNVQMVVSTTVVGEDSGAPQVVAAHVW